MEIFPPRKNSLRTFRFPSQTEDTVKYKSLAPIYIDPEMPFRSSKTQARIMDVEIPAISSFALGSHCMLPFLHDISLCLLLNPSPFQPSWHHKGYRCWCQKGYRSPSPPPISPCTAPTSIHLSTCYKEIPSLGVNDSPSAFKRRTSDFVMEDGMGTSGYRVGRHMYTNPLFYSNIWVSISWKLVISFK